MLDIREKYFLRGGAPGDCFAATEGSLHDHHWAIWKVLDGADLVLARELGYNYSTVAALILTGNHLSPPASTKTDTLDPPYGMTDARNPLLNREPMTYLGAL